MYNTFPTNIIFNSNISCFVKMIHMIICTYQDLTRGTSMARRDLPDLRLKGRGAHNNAIPFAVLSEYSGVSCMNGCT